MSGPVKTAARVITNLRDWRRSVHDTRSHPATDRTASMAHPKTSLFCLVPRLPTFAAERQAKCGSVAEWLECWTQAQKRPGSNRSRDAVFLFTKQQN